MKGAVRSLLGCKGGGGDFSVNFFKTFRKLSMGTLALEY